MVIKVNMINICMYMYINSCAYIHIKCTLYNFKYIYTYIHLFTYKRCVGEIVK